CRRTKVCCIVCDLIEVAASPSTTRVDALCTRPRQPKPPDFPCGPFEATHSPDRTAQSSDVRGVPPSAPTSRNPAAHRICGIEGGLGERAALTAAATLLILHPDRACHRWPIGNRDPLQPLQQRLRDRALAHRNCEIHS